jgi:hypothetical protein
VEEHGRRDPDWLIVHKGKKKQAFSLNPIARIKEEEVTHVYRSSCLCSLHPSDSSLGFISSSLLA